MTELRDCEGRAIGWRYLFDGPARQWSMFTPPPDDVEIEWLRPVRLGEDLIDRESITYFDVSDFGPKHLHSHRHLVNKSSAKTNKDLVAVRAWHLNTSQFVTYLMDARQFVYLKVDR